MRARILSATVAGSAVQVSALARAGRRPPIVFLHGFGASKEDFADAALRTQFNDRGLLAFDAPGFGATECSDLSVMSVDFLRDVATEVIAQLGFTRYHLVGHSMGGLVGLLLASECRDAVLSFSNIEGNLAAEDCFLSRQVLTYPSVDAATFFGDFVQRVREMPGFASGLYAARLASNVRIGAVRPIFDSMVFHTDRGDLLDRFRSLSCPRMFMYGEQNRTLTYLDALRGAGVTMVEVPWCGHFPMYSNPPAMWQGIAAFVDATECGP